MASIVAQQRAMGEVVFSKDDLKQMEKDRLKGNSTIFWGRAKTMKQWFYQIALYASKYLNDDHIVDQAQPGDNTRLVEQYCALSTWFRDLLYQTTTPTTLTTITKQEQYLLSRTAYIRASGQKDLKLNRLSEKIFLDQGVEQYTTLLEQLECQPNVTFQELVLLQQIVVFCAKIVLTLAPVIDEGFHPKLYQIIDKQEKIPPSRHPIKPDSYNGLYTFYQKMISIIHFTYGFIFRSVLDGVHNQATRVDGLLNMGQTVVETIFYLKIFCAKFNRQNDIFYDNIYSQHLPTFFFTVYTNEEIFSPHNPFFSEEVVVPSVTHPQHNLVNPGLFLRYFYAISNSYKNLYSYHEYVLNNGVEQSLILHHHPRSSLNYGNNNNDKEKTVTHSSLLGGSTGAAAAPAVVLPTKNSNNNNTNNNNLATNNNTSSSGELQMEKKNEKEVSRLGSFFRRKSVSKANNPGEETSHLRSMVSGQYSQQAKSYGVNESVMEPGSREFDYTTHVNNFVFLFQIYRKYMALYFERSASKLDPTKLHIFRNFLALVQQIILFHKLNHDHMLPWFDQYFNYTAAQGYNLRHVLFQTVYDVFNKLYLDIKDHDMKKLTILYDEYRFKLTLAQYYVEFLEPTYDHPQNVVTRVNQDQRNRMHHVLLRFNQAAFYPDLSTTALLEEMVEEGHGLTKEALDVIENFTILHDNWVKYEENMRAKATRFQEMLAERKRAEEAAQQEQDAARRRAQDEKVAALSGLEMPPPPPTFEDGGARGRPLLSPTGTRAVPRRFESTSRHLQRSRDPSPTEVATDPAFLAKKAENQKLIEAQTQSTQQKLLFANAAALLIMILFAAYFYNSESAVLRYGSFFVVLLLVVGCSQQVMAMMKNNNNNATEQPPTPQDALTQEKEKVTKAD